MSKNHYLPTQGVNLLWCLKSVDGYLELSSPGQLQPLPLGDGNEGKWLPEGLLAHLNKA